MCEIMQIAVKREGELIMVEIINEDGEREHLAEVIDQGEEGHLFTKESSEF